MIINHLSTGEEDSKVFMVRKLIVDASVGIKWYLPEEQNLTADIILHQFNANKIDIVVPFLFRLEVVNSLLSATLSKRITYALAESSVRNFLKQGFNIIDLSAQNYRGIYEFAHKYSLSVYDANYVLLAEQENCNFVTADRKLFLKINDKKPTVKWIDNFFKEESNKFN